MEPYEHHLSLLTALAIGLLIGLEREQAKANTGGGAIGGIRTYPIFALIGAVSTILGNAAIWMPLIALLGVIALLAISYAGDVRKGADHGMTTESSVIATFLLGSLAAARGVVEPMSTRLLLVAALGVTITFLLSSKQRLHGYVAKISREDLFSTVKFLIVAAIVLPLLPREPMGPLDAINPFSVGLMVVLISGLSFLGYVAMRLYGKGRGVLLSAAIGGLVSSTATTISWSNRAKENPKLVPVAATAIAIASTIMIVRVGVLVFVINPELLRLLGPALAGAALGAIAGGLAIYKRGGKQKETDELDVKNPFELSNAIRFGIAFAVILLATKAARQYLGDEGLYLAAGVAGMTDVDAVSLSTARQAGPADVAAVIAILIAVASNTIVKSSIALAIGGKSLGKRAFVIGALIIAGGALGAVRLLV